jgi:hypothetical protein
VDGRNGFNNLGLFKIIGNRTAQCVESLRASKGDEPCQPGADPY